MEIQVHGGEMSQAEQNAYVEYLKRMHPDRIPTKVDLTIDKEGYVDIKYEYNNVPFERIRRITGYLVGTLDRWNDGKRAEEHDRVKHSASIESPSLSD